MVRALELVAQRLCLDGELTADGVLHSVEGGVDIAGGEGGHGDRSSGLEPGDYRFTEWQGGR